MVKILFWIKWKHKDTFLAILIFQLKIVHNNKMDFYILQVRKDSKVACKEMS